MWRQILSVRTHPGRLVTPAIRHPLLPTSPTLGHGFVLTLDDQGSAILRHPVRFAPAPTVRSSPVRMVVAECALGPGAAAGNDRVLLRAPAAPERRPQPEGAADLTGQAVGRRPDDDALPAVAQHHLAQVGEHGQHPVPFHLQTGGGAPRTTPPRSGPSRHRAPASPPPGPSRPGALPATRWPAGDTGGRRPGGPGPPRGRPAGAPRTGRTARCGGARPRTRRAPSRSRARSPVPAPVPQLGTRCPARAGRTRVRGRCDDTPRPRSALNRRLFR